MQQHRQLKDKNNELAAKSSQIDTHTHAHTHTHTHTHRQTHRQTHRGTDMQHDRETDRLGCFIHSSPLVLHSPELWSLRYEAGFAVCRLTSGLILSFQCLFVRVSACLSVCLSVCQVIKSVVWFAAQRRRPAIIDKLPLTFIEQRQREECVGG